MKKLLISLSIIGVIAAVGVGISVALFNDTEISAGNTFTAGGLDLKVDNTGHYNGYICQGGQWTCEPWADYVEAFDQGVRKNGSPVLAERSDPTKALGPAQYSDTPNFVSLGFTTGINGYIVLGYTNKILNGTGYDLKVVETSYGNPSESAYPEKAKVYVSKDGINWSYLGIAALDEQFDMDNGLASDESTPFVLDWAKFVKLQDISDKTSPNFPNDADGFDVDGVQAFHCSAEPVELEGKKCDLSWALEDIGPTHKFFDYEDIKPGDQGEDTISFHVYDNPAYACVIFHNVNNNENGLIDPEAEAGDTTEEYGELPENLTFFAWVDDGDNIWEGGEEPLFNPQVGSGAPLVDGEAYALAVPQTAPIQPSTTHYIGIAWCAGTLTVGDFNALTCDGSTMGDEAQTDQLSADISFYIEQARNNSNFNCGSVELPIL